MRSFFDLFDSMRILRMPKGNNLPRDFLIAPLIHRRTFWDYTDDEEEKGIYITSTKSIDSIDPNKLVYDLAMHRNANISGNFHMK